MTATKLKCYWTFTIFLPLYLALQGLCYSPLHGESVPEQLSSSLPTEKQPLPFFGVDPEVDDDSRFWTEMGNMLITLGMIVGILVALTWIMKKMQNTRLKFANDGSLIKVIDHRPISTKSAVYLLHVHDRAILIADSANGTTCLAVFPLNDGVEATENTPQQAESRAAIFSRP